MQNFINSFLVKIFYFSFFFPFIASADLQPVFRDIGKISISADAEGNNMPSGGIIRVDKPSGATVRKAFLIANSHGANGTRIIADGDVLLAGVPISWDRDEFNGLPGSPSFFHNVFADVTSVVAPLVDVAQPGIVELNVSEVDTESINGTILFVIFDDPNQTDDNGIILLFGGQSAAGDTFKINLARPINIASGKADMGLGVSHSSQGLRGTPVANEINVNGVRITSSAGGEDDGEIEMDGALITVGGIGDRNDNPGPFIASSSLHTDDELYDLRPFLDPNSPWQIEVSLFNPTDDNNIFFAYFFTSVPSAIFSDVSPPGDRILIGNIDSVLSVMHETIVPPGEKQPLGDLDPDLPTIVLTHGLQQDQGRIGILDIEDFKDLWTGTEEKQATALIRKVLEEKGDKVNIVRYIWQEGFQELTFGLPTGHAYIHAADQTNDAGTDLAKKLVSSLGRDYDKPIHFIGHSLGTAVNTYAARAFINESSVTHVQFTALDRPDNITKIPGISSEEKRKHGFNANFFAINFLQTNLVGLDLRVDNYYTLDNPLIPIPPLHLPIPAGVGTEANGDFVYNHPSLSNSGLAGLFIEECEFCNNHSGVQQWYRLTINPVDMPFPNGEPGCNNDQSLFFTPVFFNINEPVNVCEVGWFWSLNRNPDEDGFPEVFPEPNGKSVSIISKELTLLFTTLNISSPTCEAIGKPITGFRCFQETSLSSPVISAFINIPSDAEFLSFDYAFINTGDPKDFAVVEIDNTVVWQLSGKSVVREGMGFTSSGSIPIDGFSGERELAIRLMGEEGLHAGFEIKNFQTHAVHVDTVDDDTRKKNGGAFGLLELLLALLGLTWLKWRQRWD